MKLLFNSNRYSVISRILTRSMSEIFLDAVDPNKMEDVDKLIYIDKVPYTVVSEGKAEVLFPSSHDVFYNPVQEFNRDLSIAVLKQFVKKASYFKRKKGVQYSEENIPKPRVLEALAASGLRSIRFAKEVPNIGTVTANDRDFQAFESTKRNILHNKVQDIVEATNEDASLLMYEHRQYIKRFDVIDLDPYGTATPFLDSAVQCVTDGGLLMITCTDMAVLCGNGVEACHAKYGSISLKLPSCHEMALRILLRSIESHANRYGRYIEPLLSLSVDFYVRVFVRIFTGPAVVKDSMCKLSTVYTCTGCDSFYLSKIGEKLITEKGKRYVASSGPPLERKCNNCGHSHKMGGPIWSENIHNKEFVSKTLKLIEEEKDLYGTSKRMMGMLSLVLEELDDCPLFHKTERLTSIVHVASPTNIQLRSAILNAGYKVSFSHTSPTSIKTNAPNDVIWDIIRTWAKENSGKKTYELEPSKTIMSQKCKIDISFENHPDANPESRLNNLLRFQMNPARNWGPKSRSTTSLLKCKEEEKRQRHQNKKRRRKNKTENGDEKKLKRDEVTDVDS